MKFTNFYFLLGESQRRPHLDSHNRLFGNFDRAAVTPRSYHKSNIPIGNDSTDAAKGNHVKVANGNGVHGGLNGNSNDNNHKGANGDNIGNGHTNGTTNGSRPGE